MTKKQFNAKYLYHTYNVSGLTNKKEDIKSLNKGNLLFYKYYPLTNEFAIGNILNSIIHFSDPRSFNDPFDSYVGIAFDQYIYDNIINIVKNTVKEKDLRDEILFFLEVKHNKEDITSLIEKMGLKKDIEQYKDDSISDEEFNNVCKEKAINYIKNILTRYFGESHLMVENFNGIFNDKKIIKFFNHDNDTSVSGNFLKIIYYVMEWMLSLEIDDAQKKEILEFKFKMTQLQENLINFYKNVFVSQFKIFCLTTNYKNSLMWSHYASSHNGICVEYDFEYASEDLINFLFPIVYNNNRPLIKLNKIKQNNTQSKVTMVKSLLTKSRDWSYEDEWRIILPNTFLNEKNDYPTPKVTKVYVGVNVSNKDFELIKEELKRYDDKIQIVKFKLSYQKFELERESLIN